MKALALAEAFLTSICRLCPYFKMRHESTIWDLQRRWEKARFVQVFTHVEGIKRKAWRLEEGLWGELSENCESSALHLFIVLRKIGIKITTQKVWHMSLATWKEWWTQSQARQIKGQEADCGWLAALTVELRETNTLEQSVLPEFLRGKGCVIVSHRPGEGKERQSRAGGVALPFLQQDSLRREKLEVCYDVQGLRYAISHWRCFPLHHRSFGEVFPSNGLSPKNLKKHPQKERVL